MQPAGQLVPTRGIVGVLQCGGGTTVIPILQHKPPGRDTRMTMFSTQQLGSINNSLLTHTHTTHCQQDRLPTQVEPQQQHNLRCGMAVNVLWRPRVCSSHITACAADICCWPSHAITAQLGALQPTAPDSPCVSPMGSWRTLPPHACSLQSGRASQGSLTSS
jgi:hypothetical protein